MCVWSRFWLYSSNDGTKDVPFVVYKAHALRAQHLTLPKLWTSFQIRSLSIYANVLMLPRVPRVHIELSQRYFTHNMKRMWDIVFRCQFATSAHLFVGHESPMLRAKHLAIYFFFISSSFLDIWTPIRYDYPGLALLAATWDATPIFPSVFL